MASTAFRIFVSSPGDVGFERRIALAVIERLRGEFGAHLDICPILWEHQPLRATEHFQEQIASTAEVDLVLFVLWTRLGTVLPEQFQRDDGTRYASGTEFEFEEAARAYHASGTPLLLAYIKKAERTVSLADRASALDAFAQKDALDGFVDQWFGNPQATFRAAFKSFENADEFERVLEADLRALITERRPAAAGMAAAAAPITWSRGSPFRGLSTFEFEHAPIYFGRTRAIGDVRAALVAQEARACAFLLVLGMSGSGKSSLIHAGVLPALTQPGVVEGVDAWCWCSLRPSGHQADLLHGLAASALHGLATAGVETGVPGTDAMAALLRQSPALAAAELGRGLQRIAAAHAAELGLARAPRARLIVVVDQFEELFALADIGAAARRTFVDALDALARSGTVWVIATMRSDFYFHCAELPVLVRLKGGAGQYELLPAQRREIEQMVRSGASAAGLRFERVAETGEALDEVLVDAAAGHPAALPLLEFALEELYRRRTSDDLLSFAAYRGFGGLEGAISRRAEEVHGQLAPATQARVPEVFKQLLTLRLDESGATSAVRVARSSLPAGAEIAQIVDAFVEARLFVSDRTSSGEAAISVAHEALLSHWPRLVRWAEDNKAFLERRAHMLIETQQWLAHGRDESLLIPKGPQLDKAEDLLAGHRGALPGEIGDYISASTRQHRSGGKWLWLTIGAVLALLIVLGTLSTIVGSGVETLRLDILVPYTGLAAWMLFIAHLRWRAEPRRVARRKSFLFTMLIAAVLVFGLSWRVAAGIEAEGWRNEMVNDIGAVMLVVYGTYVALDLLLVVPPAMRARQRRRFWLSYGIVALGLLAVVPTDLYFSGGASDSARALSLMLAGGLLVLLVTFVRWPGRAGGGPAAGAPAGTPDRLAGTVAAVLLLSIGMYMVPPGIDALRSRTELCGDVDNFFENSKLRCSAAPRAGFATIKLVRKRPGGPVSGVSFVDADDECTSRLALPPRLQFIAELQFFELGLGHNGYCRSELHHDAKGRSIGETLFDGNDHRVAYTNTLDDDAALYGAKPGIYLGRLRRDPSAPSGESVLLAEFNGHAVTTPATEGVPAQPFPTRRLVFNHQAWLTQATHLDAAGKAVLIPAIGYARVRLRYADDGALLEAGFFDADDRPVALKAGHSRVVWDYETNGACKQRTEFGLDGQRLNASAGCPPAPGKAR